MADFTQIINRESQLKAVLDGYENVIQGENWLSQAFQKDGIQNGWDARVDKKHGKDWELKIYFTKPENKSLVVLEDSGTKGLTGKIPKSKEEWVKILQKEDPDERLSYFISSDWSKKEGGSIGSRGRGKMILLGSSSKSKIYFESIRFDDKKYIFGQVYLDHNKEIQVSVNEGSEADDQRILLLGETFSKLDHEGTRIVVPDPKKDLVDPITSGNIIPVIQSTWWEILGKFKAKILVGTEDSLTRVRKSEWLPIENSSISIKESSEPIPVGINGFRIKRISFAYSEDKKIPEHYQGISIQRGGMSVEKRAIYNYSQELPLGTFYGSVELEPDLEDEIQKLESPEHYTFTWYKGVANKVNKIIKEKFVEFCQENNLLDDKTHTPKEQREAEIAAQKELNKLAQRLGLTGMGFKKKKKKKKVTPEEYEKIFLSLPDFKTPYDSGRVDLEQKVTGAYVLPVSNYKTRLKVLVRVWIFREGGIPINSLFKEKELELSDITSDEKIGWEEILIDSRFTKGKYSFRAKILSTEDKELEDGREVEKGEILYREISKNFWVEEDPPDTGFFTIQRSDKELKSKYIWWEEGPDSNFLFWNGLHPALKIIEEDKIALQEILEKEGIFFIWSIFFSNVLSDQENYKGKFKNEITSLSKESFETQLKWILDRKSESFWN